MCKWLLLVGLVVVGLLSWQIYTSRGAVTDLEAVMFPPATPEPRPTPRPLAVTFVVYEVQIPAPAGVSAAETRLLCVHHQGRALTHFYPLPEPRQTLPGVIRARLDPWITDGYCDFYGYGIGTLYGRFQVVGGAQ